MNGEGPVMFSVELDLSAFANSPPQSPATAALSNSGERDSRHDHTAAAHVQLHTAGSSSFNTSVHFVSTANELLQNALNSEVAASRTIFTEERSLGVWKFCKRKRKLAYTSLQGERLYGSEAMKRSRFDKASSCSTLRLELKSLCRRANALHALKEGQHTTSFTSLEDWGVPSKVAQRYAECGVTSLFSWQCDCLSVDGGRSILSGRNLVYRL
jgi:hypothetical protein